MSCCVWCSPEEWQVSSAPRPCPSLAPSSHRCRGMTPRRSPPPEPLCPRRKPTLCPWPTWAGPSGVCHCPCSARPRPRPGSHSSFCSEARPCSVVQAPPPTSPPVSLTLCSLSGYGVWAPKGMGACSGPAQCLTGHTCKGDCNSGAQEGPTLARGD